MPAALDSSPTLAALLRDATGRLAATGIATARQDAETLLARACGINRLGLYTGLAGPAPGAARQVFADLLARRLRQEPLQYLLGTVEFCGLTLDVGPGVFIPRPETEELVGRALRAMAMNAARVLEPCAGSGAIACALAARRPTWTVWAVEQAPAALRCARANVRRLGLDDRVHLVAADLFPLRPLDPGVPAADLLVANPPYLATGVLPTLPVEVRDWEPTAALDGGPDGLDVVRRLVAGAPEWLRSGGGLFLEVGEDQGATVTALVAADGRYADAVVHRDFRGAPRFLEAWRR